MAVESSKVRLVRCPKCENLLPELPDYSIYKCGGCGAILRAKKKGNLEGSDVLERSDEESVGVVSGKSEVFSEKSEKFEEKGRHFGDENVQDIVSVNVESNNETVAEGFGKDSKQEVSKWEEKEDVDVDVDVKYSKLELGNESVNLNKNEVSNGNLDAKVNKLETHVENANDVRKSGRLSEHKLSNLGEEERFGKTRRGYFEEMRSSSSNNITEGGSKYRVDSSYQKAATRVARVEDDEPDREELLRRLDELKDQLSRAQRGNEKSRERAPEPRMVPQPYLASEEYFHDHPSNLHRVSRQFSTPNKHVTGGDPYFDQYHEPFAPTSRPDMASHSYHNSVRGSNYVPRYEDPIESQMYRRPPVPRITNHHQYITPELDPFEAHSHHPYDMTLNHHSCSCYRCYDQHQQVPPPVPPPAFGNRRFPHIANKPMPWHHEPHGGSGSHGYNSRNVNPPLGSRDPQPYTRYPSDLKLESKNRILSRHQRVVLANGHRYRPVSGGAPFVTCQNCFELLKMPKRVFSKKGDWQMSCGACSSVISFAMVDEKLVPVDASAKLTKTEPLGTSNNMSHVHVRRDNGSYCSEDYANSIYDFQAMDRDPISSSTCQGVSSSKSEEMHNLHSLSATTSEDEHFSDDLASKQAELPEKVVISPPLGSPPQDPFDYTAKYRAVNRTGKGNLSSRSDQERVIPNKTTLRQNSLKESLATEMDLSLNEYAHSGVSKDTTDKCKEDDHPKGKKGDSFLAGILKKSFRDFSKSNQTIESTKRNVTVNGHLIPDRLVKKAEKMAGPVYPGQYWYDYRAGFWGVIGGPCLGIIPPLIEEFNYPIPEDCAAGNTGVYVNGRELHQKDLDLLSSRGLPALKDKSYIIDISGRVVDEDTAEELDNLGKLAPTIEKVKHGFGMRAPKPVA